MSIVEDDRPAEGEDEDTVEPDDYDGNDDNDESDSVVPPDVLGEDDGS